MSNNQSISIKALVDSFSEFKEFKNIDRVTMMRVLEDVFRNMLKKRYGDDHNFDIIINTEQGDLEIYRNRLIVDEDEVEDENLQISKSSKYSSARSVSKKIREGSIFSKN